MMEKSLEGKQNIEHSYSFFFVYYNYLHRRFSLAFWIFLRQRTTLVSQIVISTILSDFLDGLEAEKQNVGINRTDSRHRSPKFSPPGCLRLV